MLHPLLFGLNKQHLSDSPGMECYLANQLPEEEISEEPLDEKRHAALALQNINRALDIFSRRLDEGMVNKILAGDWIDQKAVLYETNKNAISKHPYFTLGGKKVTHYFTMTAKLWRDNDENSPIIIPFQTISWHRTSNTNVRAITPMCVLS